MSSRATRRERGPVNEICTCRFASTRANPRLQFSFLLHFLITKTLVSSAYFGGSDGVCFRLPLLLVGQTVGSWSRTSGSLFTACARHSWGITYAGRWFLPLSVRLLPAPTHSISGLPSSCRIARLSGDPIRKSPGAPSTKERERAQSALACYPP